jgi:hypothetical protein
MKHRLFVLGDSFAFNYFAKEPPVERPKLKPFLSHKPVEAYAKKHNYYGHWSDYLKEFYNVFNYAEPGCSNQDITHQLGFIPKYENGDRLVIIFSNASRYNWFNEEYKRKAITTGSIWQTLHDKKTCDILNQQLVERDFVWNQTDGMENEQNFYEHLNYLYRDYKPVMISWDKSMGKMVKSIKYIPQDDGYFTTISQESNGGLNDGHFGFEGNYKLFKFISNLLGIDENSLPPISVSRNMI